MTKKSSTRRGLGPFTVLTFIFITLKLTDHISWSWWWVLSPLWGFAVLFIIVTVLLVYVEADDKEAKANAKKV